MDRCNTAAYDSMEDMPSTVCVSGTGRILVDVMVAQLSRVQDMAVVLLRSNTTRIGRRDIFLPSDPPRRIIAHDWYVVCQEKRMQAIGVVAPLMP